MQLSIPLLPEINVLVSLLRVREIDAGTQIIHLVHPQKPNLTIYKYDSSNIMEVDMCFTALVLIHESSRNNHILTALLVHHTEFNISGLLMGLSINLKQYYMQDQIHTAIGNFPISSLQYV